MAYNYLQTNKNNMIDLINGFDGHKALISKELWSKIEESVITEPRMKLSYEKFVDDFTELVTQDLSSVNAFSKYLILNVKKFIYPIHPTDTNIGIRIVLKYYFNDTQYVEREYIFNNMVVDYGYYY